MKPQNSVVINVNLDWRVLLILGIVIATIATTYVAAVAQEGGTPDANSQEVESVAEIEQAVETTWPAQPEGGDFLPTANYEWVSAADVGAAPLSAAEAEETTASGANSHFYLTKLNYTSNVAKSACASGYHMASLWEILDPSNLTYDYNHPQAYTKADSGLGAPSYWNGRVRTGYDSNGSSTTGSGNCLNWTTTASTNYGVFVRLSRTWETAPGDIGPWDATKFTCNVTGPVWCVGN